MKDYYVTPSAGAYVAGMPNPGEGEVLRLNEKQAEHELRLGSLSTEPPAPPAPAELPSKSKGA